MDGAYPRISLAERLKTREKLESSLDSAPLNDADTKPDAKNRKSFLRKTIARGAMAFGALTGVYLTEDLAFNFQNTLGAFAAFDTTDFSDWVNDGNREKYFRHLDSNPRLAIPLFPILYKEPRAIEKVRESFRDDILGQRLAVSILVNHARYSRHEWGRLLLNEALASIPSHSFFTIYPRIKGVPNVEERAMREAPDIPPEVAALNFNVLRHLPEIEKRYRIGAAFMAQSTRFAEHFEQFNLAPTAEQDLLNALQRVDAVIAQSLVKDYGDRGLLSPGGLAKAQEITKVSGPLMLVQSAAAALNYDGVAEHLGYLRGQIGFDALGMSVFEKVAPLVAKAPDNFWSELEQKLTRSDGRRRVKTSETRYRMLKELSDRHGGKNPLELARMVQLVVTEALRDGNPEKLDLDAAAARIKEAEKRNEDFDIFNRRVVIIAAHEKYRDGHRFGNDRFIKAVDEARTRAGVDIAKSPTIFIRAKSDSVEDQLKTRHDVMRMLRETSVPTLFIFTGHGTSTDWSFGSEHSSVLISGITIAAELGKSAKKHGAPGTVEPHAFVFNACKSGDLVQLVASIRTGMGQPGIIGISSSEDSELSYTDRGHPLHSEVFSLLTESRTLGDFRAKTRAIDRDFLSNPTVIVPPLRKNGTYVRISGLGDGPIITERRALEMVTSVG